MVGRGPRNVRLVEAAGIVEVYGELRRRRDVDDSEMMPQPIVKALPVIGSRGCVVPRPLPIVPVDQIDV